MGFIVCVCVCERERDKDRQAGEREIDGLEQACLRPFIVRQQSLPLDALLSREGIFKLRAMI